MMLWDIIRDFFVQYIWGGYTSEGYSYIGYVGQLTNSNFDYLNDTINTADFYIPIGNVLSGQDDITYTHICFGDWLSTTSTIIVLILMCVFLYCFIRWAFRLTAGLFQGR